MDLVVEAVDVARGGVAVLADVSLTIAPGEAVVLRGPNGSGKTTLLRAIAGLQRPVRGRITGTEDRIAYAGHADGIKAMLSVSENLWFWARAFGQDDIKPALDAFALHNLQDRLAGTLSAGQKRRLGLSRLLVTGRPVWILDEPTVSLDTATVAQFADAVRGHLAQGGSALIATHIDLGLAARLFDVTPYRAQHNAMIGTSDEAFL